MGMLDGSFFGAVCCIGFLSIFVTTLQLVEFLSTQTANIPLKYPDDADFVWPLLVDLGLLLLFVGQHSLMALSHWKQMVAKWGLIVIERSLYVLATAVCLHLIMLHWQPLPVRPLWYIDTEHTPLLNLFFFLLHLVAWILIYAASLTMDFPELVGVKQVYYYFCGFDLPMSLKSRPAQRLYRHMRHSGIFCFLLVLWVHPVMTLERFCMAWVWSMYFIFGQRVTDQDYYYLKGQIHKKKIQFQRFEIVG